MTIKCLLVDDEPPAIRIMRSHISQIKDFEIVGECYNGIEAHEIMHQKKVDLIFLDIQMPKISGTDFLKNLSHPPLVIFVTAFRDYASDGFDLDAVDYLVKPVSFERFLKSVSKVKKILGQEQSHFPKEDQPGKDAFVYLKVDKHMEKIFIQDILYIESWKDYVKVFLTNGKSLLAKRSISSIQSLLPAQRFLRVHRSYIVAVDKVNGFNNARILVGNLDIPIGRLYKQQVLGVIQ